MPQAFVDHQVMKEMHWSWEQLQATPFGVRAATWDLIRLERAAAAERAEHDKRAAAAKDGSIRVAR